MGGNSTAPPLPVDSGSRYQQIIQEEANVASIVDSEWREEDGKEDDEGAPDERDIWEVAHVTEKDFETTEGEAEELYDKLMAMAGWTATDKQKENDLTWFLFDKVCPTWPSFY